MGRGKGRGGGGGCGCGREGRKGGARKGLGYINPTATSRTLSRSAKSVKSSQAFWVRALRLEGRRVCCASSRRGIVVVVVVVVGWVCIVKSDWRLFLIFIQCNAKISDACSFEDFPHAGQNIDFRVMDRVAVLH